MSPYVYDKDASSAEGSWTHIVGALERLFISMSAPHMVLLMAQGGESFATLLALFGLDSQMFVNMVPETCLIKILLFTVYLCASIGNSFLQMFLVHVVLETVRSRV